MPKLVVVEDKICENCGSSFNRAIYNGRVEDVCRFRVRRFCSHGCFSASLIKQEVGDQGLMWRARRHRKLSCEVCGGGSRLQAHHVDRNRRNNDPSNIQTLCSTCHALLHWREDSDGKKRRWVRVEDVEHLISVSRSAAQHLPTALAEALADAIARLTRGGR